jgi:hypothetical protein
MDTLEVLHLEH